MPVRCKPVHRTTVRRTFDRHRQPGWLNAWRLAESVQVAVEPQLVEPVADWPFEVIAEQVTPIVYERVAEQLAHFRGPAHAPFSKPEFLAVGQELATLLVVPVAAQLAASTPVEPAVAVSWLVVFV